MIVDQYVESVSMPVEIDGERVNAYYEKRTFDVNNVNIQNNYMGDTGVFKLDRFVNIEFDTVTIQSNHA